MSNMKHCPRCRATARLDAMVCRNCGHRFRTRFAPGAPRHLSARRSAMGATRTAAGLCAIVLGALGIHKFLLGYMAEGAIMAAVTVAGLLWTWTNMPGAAMAIIGIIEGIMYLTKTDAEFTNTYIVHRRGWF